MARRNKTTAREHESRFPRCIQNMIHRAYKRGDHSTDACVRINTSTMATRLGIEVTPQQVAAAYAWITMRG